MQTSTRNGRLIGAIGVAHGDEVILTSDQGTLMRTAVAQISLVGRNTQGVRVMNMKDGERLTGLSRIAEPVEAIDDDAAPLADADGVTDDGVQEI